MVGHLHFITDTRLGRDPLDFVPAVLDAGVDVIQVRAKDLNDNDAYHLTARVVELCAHHRAVCIVDDRVDVALAAGAAGVHLGEGDLPVAAARAVAGPRFVIGATARDPAAAVSAATAGASYLGVGPCFATSTKRGLPAPIGVPGLAAVRRAVDIPLIAVGGVRADRVAPLVAAGAHGIAVVDAISGASDPADAARELLAALGAAT